MAYYKKDGIMGPIALLGNQKHYLEIDFLKGFSIFTIVIMHLLQSFVGLPGLLFKLASLGGTGVHVFIFTSGFGLFYSHLCNPLPYKTFLFKRFSKIYIPYILIVVISAAFPFMYDGSDLAEALLSHVFLYKMFVPRYNESLGGQLWFMSTIIQFYLAFGALRLLRQKLGAKQFAYACLIISVFWWLLTVLIEKNEQRVWGSFFLQYLWEFALGMNLAGYLKSGHSIALDTSKLAAIGIGNLAVFGILGFLGGPLKAFNDIPALVGYGSLALCIFSLRWFNKWILWISKFSYEWYLVHMLVFGSCFAFCPDFYKAKIVCGIVSFMFSIAIAYTFHYLRMQFISSKSSSV